MPELILGGLLHFILACGGYDRAAGVRDLHIGRFIAASRWGCMRYP